MISTILPRHLNQYNLLKNFQNFHDIACEPFYPIFHIFSFYYFSLSPLHRDGRSSRWVPAVVDDKLTRLERVTCMWVWRNHVFLLTLVHQLLHHPFEHSDPFTEVEFSEVGDIVAEWFDLIKQMPEKVGFIVSSNWIVLNKSRVYRFNKDLQKCKSKNMNDHLLDFGHWVR